MLQIEEISTDRVVLSGKLEMDIKTAIKFLTSFQEPDTEEATTLMDLEGSEQLSPKDLGIKEVWCVMKKTSAGISPVMFFWNKDKADEMAKALELVGGKAIPVPID